MITPFINIPFNYTMISRAFNIVHVPFTLIKFRFRNFFQIFHDYECVRSTLFLAMPALIEGDSKPAIDFSNKRTLTVFFTDMLIIIWENLFKGYQFVLVHCFN